MHNIKNNNLTKVLENCKSMHWLEAIEQLNFDEDLINRCNANVGQDIVYAMPWNQIHDVLDIGSDLGLMSSMLAKFATKVIAVEEVPEKAVFIWRRAQQDNLPIYPIIASITNLPFKEAMFDLITLNDVFQHPDLQVESEQLKFLSQVVRLLRPGGFLYLGTMKKHFLHRWISNLKHLFKGFPVSNHRASHYIKLFQLAGVGHIQVLAAFDKYNHQLGIYDWHQPKLCNEIHNRINGAISKIGKIKQTITKTLNIGHGLNEDILIIGREGEQPGSLFWPNLNKEGCTAQINRGNKYLVIGFENSIPTTIAEFSKFTNTEIRIKRAFQTLYSLEEEFKEEIPNWGMRWPKPIEQNTYHGRNYYRYEYLLGIPCNLYLINTYTSLAKQKKIIEQVINLYLEMCEVINARLQKNRTFVNTQHWIEELNNLDQFMQDHDLSSRIQKAHEFINNTTLAPSLIHGDFTFGNVIIGNDKKVLLIDWENVSFQGIVVVDLVRLCYDTILEMASLPKKRAEVLITYTCDMINKAGSLYGIQSKDWQHIETIYLAEQIILQQTRSGDTKEFISIYKNNDFIKRMT